jgi:two-component system, response regulator PdtaR
MRRYLVVDDNAAFAENLSEILRDTGAEVATAPSGIRALELTAGRRFDAVVTDMRMPIMTGATLVHELRRVDAGLPAIVVTAYTGETDLAAARHEGLLAVLPKPPPIERLLELLGSARRDALVALVEDDDALSDNLCEALRDRGFSAVTARSVTETDRLGEVQPFAALVDLRMPGGPDGEAMRRLSRRFPRLPMFVITAHAEAALPVETFFKPFDTGRVLAALERLHAVPR